MIRFITISTIFLLLASCHRKIHLKSGEIIDLISYNKVPFYNLDTLFKHIQPDNLIEYWEFRRDGLYDSCKIICSGGDYTKANKINEIKETWGFYTDNYFGYHYLVFIKNDSIFTHTSREGLLNFIGKIDNIYEALYLALNKDFYAHSPDKKVGLYKLVNDGFQIIGLKTISLYPINKDRYFIKVNFDGTLYTEYIDKYIYRKNEGFIY